MMSPDITKWAYYIV